MPAPDLSSKARSPGGRRARLLTVIVVLLMTSCSALMANDLEAANRLYDQGKFSEAKQRYEQRAESGPADANVFYNLGNANYRLGAPGPAILAYERALALDPAHPEAQANIALLRRQSGARLWPDSWLNHMFPRGRVDVYAIIATVAAWAALFCLVCILTLSRREKFGLWMGAIVTLLIAAYAGAAVWHFEKTSTLAVIVAKEAEARLAPAESAGPAGTLPAGSQVRVLSERGDWVYCELPGLGRGWISSRALERVRPGKV